MEVLIKFTRNPETVLKVYTTEALRKVIKVIAVTASKVKSSSAISSGIGGGQNQNQIVQEVINEELSNIANVEF